MRRRYWRASALAGLVGLIISLGMGVGLGGRPSAAMKTDAEHAKQDLAGTSIEQIEKQTKANAAKIKKATGDTPGRQTDEQTVPNARRLGCRGPRLQARAENGARSTLTKHKTGVVPIFQAVLPNGKVLMWDSVGQTAPESMPTNTFTRAMVWDPSQPTPPSARTSAGYNIFCAGYTQLAEWQSAGGRREQECRARRHRADPHFRLAQRATKPWSRGPDMAAARWYPAVQALGNNEAVIVGGGPAVPEVYQTNRHASPAYQRQRVQRSVVRVPDHPSRMDRSS